MITSGLLLWEFDRGGPTRRREPDPPPRDFQIPQDEDPTLAEPGWHPRLADYVYLADAGPPAGSGEWSFSSQAWREQ